MYVAATIIVATYQQFLYIKTINQVLKESIAQKLF